MAMADDPRLGQGESGAYRSPFRQWDEKSWVRSGSRRGDGFEAGKHNYSPALSFLLRADQDGTLSEAEREVLLTHELYNWLDFTVQLELGPVNEACFLLQSAGFLRFLPAPMKADARRIYTDEGAHAEMSAKLIDDIRSATGIEPLGLQPAFLRELQRLKAEEPSSIEPLISITFVSVSETLITGTLGRLPHDESVQQPVRDVVRDHALDEGRHHQYFKKLFEYFWPSLPAHHRRRLGLLLPRMVLAFLRPDTDAAEAVLRTMPRRFPDPARTVVEMMSQTATKAGIVASARPTLAMLSDNGVFSDPYVVEAFRSRELPAEPPEEAISVAV
jgi:hypothetical protein